MATFVTNKTIVVSVDPGFDATKVVVNGLTFSIPNAVMDVTGKTEQFLKLGGSRKTPGYLVSRYIPNKEYMVGELARKSAIEKAERQDYLQKHDMMDSKNRFETTDFEVNLMTCIGDAIIRYGKESVERHLKPELHLENPSELSTFDIIVGIALPNDWVNDVWPNIRTFVVGNHEYDIDTEDGSYHLNYTIKPSNAIPASQATSALIGTAYDDDGTLMANCDTLKNLPAIIIDGGYKTMGLFQLTSANRVTEAESNTDFAMSNVHKAVASILQNNYGRGNVYDFMIPSIQKELHGELNYLTENENGEIVSSTVDVNKIIDEQQAVMCEKLINYLDDKYDNFLETKQIIITGGTGAAYYEQLVRYFDSHRSYLKGHVILTDYEFLGQKIDPVYGVVVGLYKTLKHLLTEAYKAKNANNRVEGEMVSEVRGEKDSSKKKENSMDSLKNKPTNTVVKNVEG